MKRAHRFFTQVQAMKKHQISILSAAVAIAVSSLAIAQYRTGNDGRALDANNRVGSGGLNGGGSSSPYAINGNQIGNDLVTGNITAGRGFRGLVPYTAP